MRIIIVSGLSGSGKTIALQTLEDVDYYCVDNLPFKLIRPLAQEIVSAHAALPKTVAVGIDARNFIDDLSDFPSLLMDLRRSGLQIQVVFLQADDSILLKRYHETRRRHPLDMGTRSLEEAIAQERRLLSPIAACADIIIDTGTTSIYQLREQLRAILHHAPHGRVSVIVESFGFKNGVPAGVDFIFDVRCLPNPHWEPDLRSLNGLDEPVAAFLNAHAEVSAMVEDIGQFLTRWLPHFEQSDRCYLTVAIGCTGGQHRSVFVAEQLKCHFKPRHPQVMVRHRELGRGGEDDHTRSDHHQ